MGDIIKDDVVKQAYVHEDMDGTIKVASSIAVIIISYKNVVAGAYLDEHSEMFRGVILSSGTKESTPVVILESSAIFSTPWVSMEFMKKVIDKARIMHQRSSDRVDAVLLGAIIG